MSRPPASVHTIRTEKRAACMRPLQTPQPLSPVEIDAGMTAAGAVREPPLRKPHVLLPHTRQTLPPHPPQTPIPRSPQTLVPPARLITRAGSVILARWTPAQELRASSIKGLTKAEYLPHYHKCRVIHESSCLQGRPLNATRITPRWPDEAGTRRLNNALRDGSAKPGRRRPRNQKHAGLQQQTSRGQRTQPEANHAANPPPVS